LEHLQPPPGLAHAQLGEVPRLLAGAFGAAVPARGDAAMITTSPVEDFCVWVLFWLMLTWAAWGGLANLADWLKQECRRRHDLGSEGPGEPAPATAVGAQPGQNLPVQSVKRMACRPFCQHAHGRGAGRSPTNQETPGLERERRQERRDDRSDDKRRARLNCIAHLLSLIPYEEVPRDKIKLPRRSDKGGYDDQATPKGRNFVPERY
jgi:hypothetical protein